MRNTLDTDGSLQQVQSRRANDTFRNYANAFNYTAAGAVSSMRLGNGRWENTAFNSRLQPTQIGLGGSATNTSLLKLNYDYGNADNNGNVKSQTITVPTVGTNAGFTAVQNYTYDSLNRLKSATENIDGNQTPSWKQTFTFDRYGNRRFDVANTTTIPNGCAEAVCNPQIDPATNKLIGYQFDNAGNTKVDANGQTFTYDSENKQIAVTNGSGTVGQYFYDGDGKRVKKVVPNGETTIFVYDAGGKSIAEYSTIVESQAAAKTSYLTNDHLGSPRITTDGVGQVISRRDFPPYGEEIARANYGCDSVRKKFTGKERDSETTLDYFGARYYSAQIARWTTPDPFMPSAKDINPQTWNRYSYVLNNPLRYVDPNGLDYSDLDDAQKKLFQTYADKYNKDHKSNLSAENVYKTLSESQMATFEANTFALEKTELHDKKGKSLGNALSLVKSVDEILGDNVGGDSHVRLTVTLTDSAVDTLGKSKEFGSSSDIFGLHGEYSESYRQNGGLPSIQISYNPESKTRGSIDIDYRKMTLFHGEGHREHYNSDVRQLGPETKDNKPIDNYQRFIDRWPGLRRWWKQETRTNNYYEGKK